jgi:hypothetical protein
MKASLRDSEAGRAENEHGVSFVVFVSSEFMEWIRTERAQTGKTMGAFLDDMRAAYMERQEAND